jgi:hypothetical protein
MTFPEQIIKRPDGSRVKIIIELYFQSFGNEFSWRFSIATCKPKCSSFYFIADDWSNEWQRMKYVTEDEIYQAKIVAWELMKPEITTPPKGKDE